MSEEQGTYDPLSMEELRDIVNNLSQPASEPAQTDIGNTHVGYTISTDASNLTYTTITNVTDGQQYQAVPIDQVEVEPELPDILDVPRRRRGTARKKPLSEEAQRQIDEGGPTYRERKRKRERPIFDVVLSPDDMLICFTMGSIVILHNELNVTDTVRNLLGLIGTTKDENFGISALRRGFYFDKNGNILGVSTKKYEGMDKYQSDKYPAVPAMMRGNESYIYELPNVKYNKYLIIDKDKFLESRGRNFVIKSKLDVDYEYIKAIKGRFIKKFDKMMDFLETKKNIIHGVYDEEMFDIIYYQDFRSNENHLNFLFRFNDLIIKNSIEQEHKIHCLITRMPAVHYNNNLIMNGYLEGMRLIFDPIDAKFQYSHSHLSRGGFRQLAAFCMGSDHFMSNNRGALGDIEFESLLYGMYDHVAWESLEGGPYMKMESIGDSMSRPINIGNPFYFPNYHIDANKQVLDYIKSKDLNSLKSAFTLGPNSKGEITYHVDSKVFYTNFAKFFTKEWLEKFNSDWDYGTYVFIPSKNRFAQKDDGQFAGKDSWKDVVKDARKKVNTIFPVYMNGELIKPELVETEYEKDIGLDEELPCLYPGNMYVFLQIFYNKLLNGLKNEQKRR